MLRPFQKTTVKMATRALLGRTRSKRFLIADEVGLGKTIIAAEVIRRLARFYRRQGKPFCAVYFASSLPLATQNKDRLVLADGDFLRCSILEEDRLSLGWDWKPAPGLRLAVFTPGTTFPDLYARNFSTGVRAERIAGSAWASAVMGRRIPREIRLFLAAIGNKTSECEKLKKLRAFDNRVHADLRKIKELQGGERRKMLAVFSRHLRAELKIPQGTDLYRWFTAQVSPHSEFRTGLESIRRALRIALAHVTLEQGYLSPDLIIVDEFQKTPNLLYQTPMPELISSIFDKAAILLLSATPFELARAQDKTYPIERLVGFLYKDPKMGQKAAKRAKAYHAHLASNIDAPKERPTFMSAARRKRDQIEKILSPVFERTERWDDELMASPHEGFPTDFPQIDDLKVYDDMARRLDKLLNHSRSTKKSRTTAAIAASHAPAIWLSVPYPIQTMPEGYAFSTALSSSITMAGRLDAPRIISPEDQQLLARLPEAHAHPKLRAFLDEITPERELSLPWIRPSAPWWPLSGAWEFESEDCSPKSLIFSHYRASPSAIAGLISHSVERTYGPQAFTWKGATKKRFQFDSHHSSFELEVLFFPWLSLAQDFDPLSCGQSDINEIWDYAYRETDRLFRAKKDSPKHPLQRLIEQEKKVYEEKKLDYDGPESLRTPSSRRGMGTMIGKLAMGGPGVVLLRSLIRHFGDDVSTHIAEIATLSQNTLRKYLGSRYFDRALATIRGRKAAQTVQDRESLLASIVDGNLESVLDEHIAIFKTLNKKKNGLVDVLQNLKSAWEISDGFLNLHHTTTQGRKIAGRLRAYVALAYSGQETGTKNRPQNLQAGFNSPFWPNILTTTSIGQEGLDFHVWCSRVVHWDNPPNSIALEQREGRVSRFGSLAVRRALAARLADEVLAGYTAQETERSPWEIIFARAAELDTTREDRVGLRPWWVSRDGQYSRVVLAIPGSHEFENFGRLLEELNLYRLGIGQPDPSSFVKGLRGKFSELEIRDLAVDLSGMQSRRRRRKYG